MTRNRTLPLLLAATLALTLAACGDDDSDGGGGGGSADLTPADLDGKTFTGSEAIDHDLVAGTVVVLNFEDGRVTVAGGCNSQSGGYSVVDDRLEVDEPLASTMMACEPDLEAQDAWLLGLLTSSPELSLDGDTLEIVGDDGGLSLVTGA